MGTIENILLAMIHHVPEPSKFVRMIRPPKSRGGRHCDSACFASGWPDEHWVIEYSTIVNLDL